jgi:hypothetical protein
VAVSAAELREALVIVIGLAAGLAQGIGQAVVEPIV